MNKSNKLIRLTGLFTLLLFFIILSLMILSSDIKDDIEIIDQQTSAVKVIESLQFVNLQADAYNVLVSFKYAEVKDIYRDKLIAIETSLEQALVNLARLLKSYPQYETKAMKKNISLLKTLFYKYKSLPLEQKSFFNATLLDAIRKESLTLGDISTLNYEGEKKIALPASIMIHYMPEFTGEIGHARKILIEALVQKELSSSKHKALIESMELVILSKSEIEQLMNFLDKGSDFENLKKYLKEFSTAFKISKASVEDILEGKIEDLNTDDIYKRTQIIMDLSWDIHNENIKILYMNLSNRLNEIQNKLFYVYLLFMIIILLIIVSFMVIYLMTQVSEKKERMSLFLLEQSQKAIDQFTLVSKIDTNGVIRYVNEKFCETTGYSELELVGKVQKDICKVEPFIHTVKDIWTQIENGKIWMGVVKAGTKNGEELYLDILITPIFDYKHKVIEYVMISRDITDTEVVKIKLENSLNISNKNFKEAYNSSVEYQEAIIKSNHFVRLDLDGYILYANDKFCKISGYSSAELVGQHNKILRSLTVSDTFYEALWEKISSGETWEGQLENRDKNGEPYFINSSIVPLLDENGKPFEYLCISYNVTELVKKNEELGRSEVLAIEQKHQLERQKELYELVFKNTSSGVLLLDADKNEFLTCNEAGLAMLGYDSEEELLHIKPSEISPEFQPDGRRSDEKSDEMTGLCVTNKIQSFEWVHERKNGEPFWVDVFLTFIELDGKPVVHVLWRDISEKKEAEKVLTERKELLIQQARSASMGEMIANIAHQWRQPLNALGLNIQKVNLLFNKNKLDSEKLQLSTDKGMNLIGSMSQTIDDFSDFFRPNKKKEEFSPSDVLEKSFSIVESTFSHSDIAYEFHAKDKNIMLFGFSNEFSQVFVNLLKNSHDALVEKQVKSPKVIASLYEEGDVVIIKVKDNAGGIEPDVLPKVFDPYFSTKEQGKGTGIGLYMSKMIIEDHMNGEISIENEDAGVCVKMVLKKDT